MNIPCKECISYAICKHKKHICCDYLFDWYRKTNNDECKTFYNVLNFQVCDITQENGVYGLIPETRYIKDKLCQE